MFKKSGTIAPQGGGKPLTGQAFADALSGVLDDRFGMKLNSKVKDALAKNVGFGGGSEAPTENPRNVEVKSGMAMAPKMLREGGAVKRSRSIDGIATKGKTRCGHK